jgi:DNA-binding NtrC family response regulator
VRRYLDFARPAPPGEGGDLEAALSATLGLLEREADSRRIALVREGLASTSADGHCVRLGGEELKQVLFNLVRNALEAVPEGATIRVGWAARPGAYELWVADDGPGMDAATLKRVRRPFVTTRAQGHGARACDRRPAGARSGRAARARERARPRHDVPRTPAGREEGALMRILVVDDEARVGDLLRRDLTDRGHEVDAVTSSKEALGRLGEKPFELVITDLRMAPPDGLELLAQVKQKWPAVEVLLMTAYGDESTAVRAMRAGAYDYLKKDPQVDPEEIQLRIERLEGSRSSRMECERLAGEVEALKSGVVPIVGRSEALARALELARKVAPTDSTVLIRGESGTGKDLFARAIHFGSKRAAGPWVKVNCGALPENLLESELFGHEKGAFTGAIAKKIGRFEQAHGGTIFLDEIGELSPALQVKLLQALEEKAFVRVGGNETVHADVRIVAATNRTSSRPSPRASSARTCSIACTSSRSRCPRCASAAPTSCRWCTSSLPARGRRRTRSRPRAMRRSSAYSFPGNVRELQHVIERALIIAGTDAVTAEELIFQPVRRLHGERRTRRRAASSRRLRRARDPRGRTFARGARARAHRRRAREGLGQQEPRRPPARADAADALLQDGEARPAYGGRRRGGRGMRWSGWLFDNLGLKLFALCSRCCSISTS